MKHLRRIVGGVGTGILATGFASFAVLPVGIGEGIRCGTAAKANIEAAVDGVAYLVVVGENPGADTIGVGPDLIGDCLEARSSRRAWSESLMLAGALGMAGAAVINPQRTRRVAVPPPRDY